MGKNTSKKISVKISAAQPSGNTPLGDKTWGIETAIKFYDIYDRDDTEEGEESEILVVHESSLTISKKNLVKRELPYIDTFDHEGPVAVSVIHNITIGIFEHLDVTSTKDLD